MNSPVVAAVRHWSAMCPSRVALELGDLKVTYCELADQVTAVAAQMAANGVTRGEAVGVLGDNSIELATHVLGAMALGAVVIPFNFRFTADETASLVLASDTRVVYAAPAYLERVAAVRESGAEVTVLPLMSAEATQTLASNDVYGGAVIPADAPAVVVYTSGTTGRPKGVIYTNAMIQAIAFQWSLLEPLPEGELRALFVLPLTGIGIPWTLSQVLIRGGTLTLTTRFDPAEASELLESRRITWFTGVPTIFAEMAKHPAFGEATFDPRLRAVTGGATVSPVMLERWANHGVRLRALYGMTEAGGGFTALPLEFADSRADRCGRSGVFTELRVTKHGQPCAPGEIGNIEVRGPTCTPGYWRNAEDSAALYVNGWLQTGDLGELDSDGFLRFVARNKDLIITGGFNVAPAELEEFIEAFPEVEEAAVVPARHEKFGEVPAAVIRLRSRLDSDEITRRCRVSLADYKVPKKLIFVDEPLPRTRFGKLAKDVIRADVRDRLEADTADTALPRPAGMKP